MGTGKVYKRMNINFQILTLALVRTLLFLYLFILQNNKLVKFIFETDWSKIFQLARLATIFFLKFLYTMWVQ